MNFSAILGSNAQVGSIISSFDDGSVHVLCAPEAPDIGSKVVSNAAQGNSVASSDVSAKFSIKLFSFLSAQAAFSTVQSVAVTLADGFIYSGTVGDILVPFDDLSQRSKNAIDNDKKAYNTRFFQLVTRLYRGDVAVVVEHKTNVSADVAAHVTAVIAATLNGKVDAANQSTLKVTGGVWLIDTERYFVPTTA